MTTAERVKEIVKILDDKKAIDIRVFEVSELTALTDYFVIATGTSTTQVKALAEDVEYRMGQKDQKGRLEGKSTGWLLIDFGDVIVHVFLPEEHDKYSLERLWADGKEIDISTL